MKRVMIVGLALVVAAMAPATARSQGIPTGSTRVAGPPDSAFRSFVVFLKKHGASMIRADSTHQQIEAKVQGSDETIVFVFTGAGDSTAIDAQGKKGSMSALIFGLGTVNDWLQDRRAHPTPSYKP